MYALKVCASRSLRARSNNFPPRCKHLGRKLPPRHLRDGCTSTVELRDDTHLVRCQLGRNRAHLLVDVVLAKPLGECSKLPLDIGRLLRLQLGRPEFMVARTVTGGARWDPARRVPGKNKANGGVVFAKGMPGLKTLADKGREPVSAAREISPDIGRVLSRQRLSDRVHCAPRAFARAKIVELFVNRYTIHSGKCRVEAGLAHPLLTVAGGAIERDKRAVFGITGAYLGERGAGPGDAGRGSERRLRLARRPDVGGDAKRPTDRGPRPERGPILLLTAEYDKAQDQAYREQPGGRPPGEPWPWVVELERPPITSHYRALIEADSWLVTWTAGTLWLLRKKNCPIG